MYRLTKFVKVIGFLIFATFVGLNVWYSFRFNFNLVAIVQHANHPPAIYFWYLVFFYIIIATFQVVLFNVKEAQKRRDVRKYGQDIYNENILYLDVIESDPDLNQFEMMRFAYEALFFFQHNLQTRKYEALRAITTARFYSKLEEVFPPTYTYHFGFRKLKSSVLKRVDQDSNYIALTYEIAVREQYYETDDVNKLSAGSMDNRSIHIYEMVLIKRKTYKENPEKPNQVGECYNCGITLSTNDDNTCVQCNANLSSGAYGFVIDSIKLVDRKTSVYKILASAPFMSRKKFLAKPLKKANANPKKVEAFIGKNMTYFYEAQHKGRAEDHDKLMTKKCAQLFGQAVIELKASNFHKVFKRFLIWNIVLIDFFDSGDKLYYIYVVDGRKKHYIANERDRLVLGENSDLHYFVTKVIVVYDKEEKTYKLDQMFCLYDQTIR